MGLVMQCRVPGGICASIREPLRHSCANMETAAHANSLVLDIARNRVYLVAMRITAFAHRHDPYCFIGDMCLSWASLKLIRGCARLRTTSLHLSKLLPILCRHDSYNVKGVASSALQLSHNTAPSSRIMLRHPTEHSRRAATVP